MISQDGWKLIVSCLVLLPLATASVGLRLYGRRLKGKVLCFNDYTIVSSLIFAVGFSTAQIIGIALYILLRAHHLTHKPAAAHVGVGYDILEVVDKFGNDALEMGLKCLFTNVIIHAAGTALIRVSIIHFYVTIFPNHSFWRLACAVACLTVAIATTMIIHEFLACRPLAYNWDKSIQGGTCDNQPLGYLTSAILHLTADVLVFILPLPFLWTLQIGLLRKISISLIFSLGIVVCVASALRIKATLSLDFTNITATVGDLSFWATLELFLGIINACLPLLQPIIRACYSRTKTLTNRLCDRQEQSQMPQILDEQRNLRTVTTTSASTRMFRRLYDHIYPLTQFSRPDSEFTRVDSAAQVKESKQSSTAESNWI